MKKRIILFIIVGLVNNFSNAQKFNMIEKKYFDKPIIKITLNHKNAWFLFDTGCGYTILDANAKDKYGFSMIDSQDDLIVPGFGSSNNLLQRTKNANIRFGDKLLEGEVYSYDFSSIIKSIHQRTGIKISGIIGTDMMKRHQFVIDLGSKTVSMKVRVKKLKMSKQNSFEEMLVTKFSSQIIK